MRLGLPYKAKVVHQHTAVGWKMYRIKSRVCLFWTLDANSMEPSASQLHETIYHTLTTTFSKYRPVHVNNKWKTSNQAS